MKDFFKPICQTKFLANCHLFHQNIVVCKNWEIIVFYLKEYSRFVALYFSCSLFLDIVILYILHIFVDFFFGFPFLLPQNKPVPTAVDYVSAFFRLFCQIFMRIFRAYFSEPRALSTILHWAQRYFSIALFLKFLFWDYMIAHPFQPLKKNIILLSRIARFMAEKSHLRSRGVVPKKKNSNKIPKWKKYQACAWSQFPSAESHTKRKCSGWWCTFGGGVHLPAFPSQPLPPHLSPPSPLVVLCICVPSHRLPPVPPRNGIATPAI